MSMNLFQGISAAMTEGNSALLERRIQYALNLGFSAQEIHKVALLQCMGELGVMLRANEIFLTQLLQAASALGKAMDLLRPHLKKEGLWPVGRALIEGADYKRSKSGINLLTALLRAGCYDYTELQTDCAVGEFSDAITKHPPNILLLSADRGLLTGRHGTMERVAKAAGLNTSIILSMGGIHVAIAYCDKLGERAFDGSETRCFFTKKITLL